MVAINVPSFLQCFESAGWMTGRDTGL